MAGRPRPEQEAAPEATAEAAAPVRRQNLLDFDLDDYTLADLCRVEQVTGEQVTAIDWRRPSFAVGLAMYWLRRKRAEPRLTYADITGLTPSELAALDREFKATQERGEADPNSPAQE